MPEATATTVASTASAAGGGANIAPLVIGALVLFLLIFAFWLVAVLRTKAEDRSNPLTVPSGSMRAILAVTIIGGFVIFLFFGSSAVTGDSFDKVLAAFAALAGSATGFYFGSRKL
jgi:hypothetical protein